MSTKRIILVALASLPVFFCGFLIAGPGITDYNYRADSIVFVTDTTDTTDDRYVVTTGFIELENRAHDYSNLVLKIIIDSSLVDTHGFGLADSCHVWFKTWIGTDTLGLIRTLDSVKQAGLPCTLSVAYAGALADTLILPKFGFLYRIVDSTSDTTGIRAPYAYDYQYMMTD